MRLIRIFFIFIFFCFSFSKTHRLFITFTDNNGKLINKEKIQCIIKNHEGEKLDDLQIKKSKKKTKLKR